MDAQLAVQLAVQAVHAVQACPLREGGAALLLPERAGLPGLWGWLPGWLGAVVSCTPPTLTESTLADS